MACPRPCAHPPPAMDSVRWGITAPRAPVPQLKIAAPPVRLAPLWAYQPLLAAASASRGTMGPSLRKQQALAMDCALAVRMGPPRDSLALPARRSARQGATASPPPCEQPPHAMGFAPRGSSAQRVPVSPLKRCVPRGPSAPLGPARPQRAVAPQSALRAPQLTVLPAPPPPRALRWLPKEAPPPPLAPQSLRQHNPPQILRVAPPPQPQRQLITPLPQQWVRRAPYPLTPPQQPRPSLQVPQPRKRPPYRALQPVAQRHPVLLRPPQRQAPLAPRRPPSPQSTRVRAAPRAAQRRPQPSHSAPRRLATTAWEVRPRYAPLAHFARAARGGRDSPATRPRRASSQGWPCSRPARGPRTRLRAAAAAPPRASPTARAPPRCSTWLWAWRWQTARCSSPTLTTTCCAAWRLTQPQR